MYRFWPKLRRFFVLDARTFQLAQKSPSSFRPNRDVADTKSDEHSDKTCIRCRTLAQWCFCERDSAVYSRPANWQRHRLRRSKLRISNALQSSLHARDVIRGFAREVRRMVRGVAVRYRHSVQKVAIDDGARELNTYTYELNLVGRSLGDIIFSRANALLGSELEVLEVLEVLLCTLIYPLRNSLQYERALKIALKDPLTGVNNRAMLSAQLKPHTSLAQRQLSPLSLLIIDIDHFKAVNDRFGHIDLPGFFGPSVIGE